MMLDACNNDTTTKRTGFDRRKKKIDFFLQHEKKRIRTEEKHPDTNENNPQ